MWFGIQVSVHGLVCLLGWLSESMCGLAFVCLSMFESRGYVIEEEEAIGLVISVSERTISGKSSWIWFII